MSNFNKYTLNSQYFLQGLGKKNLLDHKNVIEQIQLIIIISGMDKPVDRCTFSQIVESNWKQPPSFFS
jgi:hypothetical protein